MTRFVIPATLAWMALTATAQDLSFTPLTSVTSPSARVDGVIVYDPQERTAYLFGGLDDNPRNDLWAYSFDRKDWYEVQPLGTKPPARFGHTVVFDSVRRRLIVFGGQAGGFFSDVWALDLASKLWTRLAADDAGPRRRYGHSAIYETARDRMIVSHGFTNSGRFDDTWAFDLRTGTWRDISPAGTRPLRRCLHHSAYDSVRGVMYLYGGCSSGSGPCPQGDLWAFDLATNRWTERTPRESPPPREHYGMAFDQARGRLVIFGGSGEELLNDVWEFDPVAGTWQKLIVSEVPPARFRHQTAYASDIGAILFFGGSTNASKSNEFWKLAPITARPSISTLGIVNAFSGESGAVAPGEVVSIYGANLGPQTGIAAAFDSATGKLPTVLQGVSVTANGMRAPLYFVQAGQLNVQVPYELDGSQVEFTVFAEGRVSAPRTVPLTQTHPGLFPRAWNQDGTINSPENPATRGSVVVLYVTGAGATNPPIQTGFRIDTIGFEPSAAVLVRLDGIASDVLYRGHAPGTAGVIQLNVRIPNGSRSGASLIEVVIGSAAQTGLTIHVR